MPAQGGEVAMAAPPQIELPTEERLSTKKIREILQG
jgi:hypothetical protein